MCSCILIVCGISVHVFGPLCLTALSEIVPNVLVTWGTFLCIVWCACMAALVMKYSSIGVGSTPVILSNINFDSSNLYRSSSFSILLRINNGSV